MQSTLEVRHFRFLRAIADEGSVTAASHRLHISQPALSRALSDLEQRLGLTLFHRGNRSMHPTPACRRLLRTADQVLTLVQTEEERLRSTADGSTASIRITTECYTSYRWLPQIIEQFHRHFPDVTIDIDTDVMSRPLEALELGLIDLAVVYTVHDSSRLETVELFDDELVVVVHPDHKLADQPVVRVEDFAGEHLIVYSEKSSDVVNQLLIPSGVRPARVSSIQITDGILDLVKAGLGISVVTAWAAADDVATGRLVSIPIEGGMFIRHWRAAATKETFALPHITRFVNLLVENQQAFRGTKSEIG